MRLMERVELCASARSRQEIWSRGQDLNLRPSGYEPDELPGCSTPRLRLAQLPEPRGFHLTRSYANHDYPPSGDGGQGVSVLRTAVFFREALPPSAGLGFHRSFPRDPRQLFGQPHAVFMPISRVQIRVPASTS